VYEQLRAGARYGHLRGALQGLRRNPRNASSRGVETPRRVPASCCLLRECWPAHCSPSTRPTLESQPHPDPTNAGQPHRTTWRSGFVPERERVILQQQERSASFRTPVLQCRNGLLILRSIGVIDPQAARPLTEQAPAGHSQTTAPKSSSSHHLRGRDGRHVATSPGRPWTLASAGRDVDVTGLSPELAQRPWLQSAWIWAR